MDMNLWTLLAVSTNKDPWTFNCFLSLKENVVENKLMRHVKLYLFWPGTRINTYNTLVVSAYTMEREILCYYDWLNSTLLDRTVQYTLPTHKRDVKHSPFCEIYIESRSQSLSFTLLFLAYTEGWGESGAPVFLYE